MSLRNKLNQNPMVVGAVVVVAILLAVWLIYRSVGSTGPAASNSAFYTTDDGNTWFSADTKEVPPITHDA